MKTILVKNIKMKTIKLDSDASKVCTIEQDLIVQDFPTRMLELMVAFKSSLEPTELTLQVNYKKAKPRQKTQLRLKVNKTRLQDLA